MSLSIINIAVFSFSADVILFVVVVVYFFQSSE